MHTLVVGAGFSGHAIAVRAAEHGSVCGTRRKAADLSRLTDAGLEAVVLSGIDGAVDSDEASSLVAQFGKRDVIADQLARTTHLIICSAPARQAPLDDPVLKLFSSGLNIPHLEWVGYLSTIGVYGNHQGAWVDEDAACTSTQIRSIMRRQAELGWQQQAARWQVPISILRLSGIYGPGRNAIIDAVAGRARMLIKPDQVFNRIHVDDLATATVLAGLSRCNAVINVTDDLPAPPQDVIRYAHDLVGKPAPEAVDFSSADISDMARSFYSENKRVKNELSKRLLKMRYRFPTYREGLDAIHASFDAVDL